MIGQAMLLLQVAAATGVGTDLLPAPTGPHSVGRRAYHWVDRERDELETSAPGDKRELLVYVFYPSEPNERLTRAPYMPDADVMRGPWSEAQIGQLRGMRAHSRENASLVRGSNRLPLVLLSPGGGMRALTYHTLAEDLASHGYVVAAIEPPYNARAVRMPDGRVLGNLTPERRGWPQARNQEDEIRYYRERAVHWSRDMSFVLDQLTALDRGNGPFARRLDLQRGVGALGHSRGGQVAGIARILEPRVRGGINLDGMMGPFAVQPIKGDDVGKPPFLWIHKTLPPPLTAEQLQRAGRTRAQYDSAVRATVAAWGRQMRTMSGGAMRVVIDGPDIEHIDFSDESLWNTSLTPQARAAKLKTIATTRAYVRAFFDGCVRGDWSAMRTLVGEAGKWSPEITINMFGKMWPG